MLDPVVVPGRPTPAGITWWVMAKSRRSPRLELLGERTERAEITCHPLTRPGRGLGTFLVATTGLDADEMYGLRVEDDDGRRVLAVSRSLPTSLSPGKRFTIALGSCYNHPMDIAEIHRSFPPKQHTPNSADPIGLCFLLGDQIYMDLEKSIDAHKPDSWSKPLSKAPAPWNAYTQQWSDPAYRSFLVQAGNSFLFLADDHEFWNDYPHKPDWLTWTRGDGAEKLERDLTNAYLTFQAAPNLRPESIRAEPRVTLKKLREQGLSFSFSVPPLSFFVLDTRIGRTRTDTRVSSSLTDPASLRALRRWLAEPDGLGVLAVAPPVFQGKGSAFDHNLADYEGDYRKIVGAIESATRPLVILAGDIHYSRLYTLSLAGQREPKAVEFVSSPLSRLKEPPGLRPPRGEEVVSGTLGDSGADFELQRDDNTGEHFVTTERQTYGTVSFELASDGSTIKTVFCTWGPARRRRDGAVLLRKRSLSWQIE